jgi:hypothetical protein
MDGHLGDLMIYLHFHLLWPFLAFESNDFIDELTDIMDTLLNDIVLEIFDAAVTVGQFFVIGIGTAFDVADMPVLIMIIIVISAGIALGVYGKRRTGPI